MDLNGLAGDRAESRGAVDTPAPDAQVHPSNPAPSAASDASRPIELHIDELVLEGFSGVDRDLVGDALRRELTRLLSSGYAPDSLKEAGEMARINGGSFIVRKGMHPEEIGKQIARSIFWGMR